MLSTLQIVLISVAGLAAFVSLVFFFMFIAEITAEPDEEENEEDVKSVYTEQYFINYNTTNAKQKEEEVSVDEMIANLEEQTKEEPKVEDVVVEESKTEEVVEEIEEPKVEEKVEVVEEVKPSKKEKVEEKDIEEFASIDEDAQNETSEDDAELLTHIEELKSEKHEPIVAGSVIDYKSRLEKIIENRNKIERDLAKIQKSILKYERTKRRKNRNQKMLDRRAGELTNLNLVMYSVTDIKNVDEDKKIKQEELTAHIAELKASIQDAEEFIESNKEKNEHNVKMAKFLIQEKARYNEEIAELQELINKSDDTAVSA